MASSPPSTSFNGPRRDIADQASIRQFLTSLKRTTSLKSIQQHLEDCKKLRVLLIGETIIDEYQYCNTLGKSGKEPILAAQFVSLERNAGGVVAVANHAAQFCGAVELLTQLGEIDSHEDLVLSRLARNITAHIQRLSDAPTILKRRFVEQYPFQKLFEIYVMDDRPDESTEEELRNRIRQHAGNVDLVIVTDYGHGMISTETAKVISDTAKFLAVNTQKNAGNHGFNTISKYPHVDFICVSASELQLDFRDRTSPIESLVERAADQMGSQYVIATRGGDGCLCFQRDTGIVNAPALVGSFKDRVGAGDAMFAVTALVAKVGASAPTIALIGNAIGAQAISTIANRRSVSKDTLIQQLSELLG